jgi:hypothetical protein
MWVGIADIVVTRARHYFIAGMKTPVLTQNHASAVSDEFLNRE